MQKDRLILERELASSLSRAGGIALAWLNAKPIYMSMKTTGSGKDAQVIEMAILDTDQSVMFHSQILPSVAIDPEAELSHGINLSALQGRPTLSQVLAQIMSIVEYRPIVMFNAIFNTRILKQSCQAFDLPISWLDALAVNCAMYLAANAYGTNNRYGTVSMAFAMQKAKVIGFRDDNGAVAEGYALVQILKLMANHHVSVKAKLALGKIKISA